MCDAKGRCHGWVLGGVEITEVYSGDYEIWMTGWVVGDDVTVHDLGTGRGNRRESGTTDYPTNRQPHAPPRLPLKNSLIDGELVLDVDPQSNKARDPQPSLLEHV